MRAVVVEDHYSALQDLLDLLADLCPEITVLSHAATQREAIRLIAAEKPDLVFMDIELADGGNGFSVLEAVNQPQMQVVFVSAHSAFASRAFRADNVIDFLEKPLRETELRQAVDRALAERQLRENDAQYRRMLETLPPPKRPRLPLPDQKRIIFPYIDTIIHIKAEGTSTLFYFDPPQGKMLVTKNIGEYDALIEEHGHLFMKVHRSYIVNLEKVVEYQRPTREAVMSNHEKVSISAERLDEFLRRLA